MIPFFKPDLAKYADAPMKALVEGNLGPHEYTNKFTLALSHYFNDAPVLLTTSGTIALSVIAQVALPAGSKVVVPAYGVHSVWNAFTSVGCKIVPVDIDDTGRINLATLEIVLSDRQQEISAVAYVDFNGTIDEFTFRCRAMCDQHKVIMIEDAAFGFGHQSVNGQKAGTIGHFGIMSFSPHKLITTGQGGCVIFNRVTGFSISDYRAISAFISHGLSNGQVVTRATNLRFNDILATIGLAQLEDKSRIIYDRNQQIKSMQGFIPDLMTAMSGPVPLNITHHARAPELAAKFVTHGIDACCQYHCITNHSLYSGMGKYPNAEYWERCALYLPFGLGMSDDEIREIGLAYQTLSKW